MANNAVMSAKANVVHLETGISDETRIQLVEGLTEVLAESYALLLETQIVHWNVVGPMFVPIHQLTEKQYRHLFEAVDDIAERIRALGHPVAVDLEPRLAKPAAARGVGVGTAEQMLRWLAEDHQAVSRHIRGIAAIARTMEDEVTADLLTRRLRFHEKATWMLDALLATGPEA